MTYIIIAMITINDTMTYIILAMITIIIAIIFFTIIIFSFYKRKKKKEKIEREKQILRLLEEQNKILKENKNEKTKNHDY